MTILKGRYQLHEKFAEGGMAELFRATQINLNREVAIKFIKTATADPTFESRFRYEAEAVAKLNHPNIMSIYDFDSTDDNQYFMVIELLQGQDLSDVLNQHILDEQLFTVDEVAHFMRGAAAGLSYAHQKGIIHRDIKPSNIFLTQDNRVVVMDFGIAKMNSQASLTQSGAVVGTPRYLSPEQIMGQPIDHRIDIYALGIVLYQLLTNEPPFKGDTTMELIAQHATAPIPDPRDVRPDLPEHATIMCFKAMAKTADERYSDCNELLADLEVLVNAKSTTIAPPNFEAIREKTSLTYTDQINLTKKLAKTEPVNAGNEATMTVDTSQPTQMTKEPTDTVTIVLPRRSGIFIGVIVLLLLILGGIFIAEFSEESSGVPTDQPLIIIATPNNPPPNAPGNGGPNNRSTPVPDNAPQSQNNDNNTGGGNTNGNNDVANNSNNDNDDENGGNNSESGNGSAESPFDINNVGITPAEEEFLIAIAVGLPRIDELTFKSDLATAFRSNYLSEEIYGSLIRTEVSRTPLTNSDEADQLTAQTNAAVVIWVDGVPTSDLVRIHVYSAGSPLDTYNHIIINSSVDELANEGETITEIISIYVDFLLMQFNLEFGDVGYIFESLNIQRDLLRSMTIPESLRDSSDPASRLLAVLVNLQQGDYADNDILLSALIREYPQDIGLYYLRWYNAINNQENMNVLEQDVEQLDEFLVISHTVEYMYAHNAMFGSETPQYDAVIEIYNNFDNEFTNQAYSIIEIFALMSMVYIGDFESAIEVADNMDIMDGLNAIDFPLHPSMSALIYEIVGDTDTVERMRLEVQRNGTLDDYENDGILQSIQRNIVINQNPAFLIGAGYALEIIALDAINVPYSSVLRADETNYLVRWQLGLADLEDGDLDSALANLEQAKMSAPVPFPIVDVYLAQADPDNACTYLAEAANAAETNEDLYSQLLFTVESELDERGCEVD